MSRDCSCLYKIPPSTRWIKYLCCKFCNVTLGINNFHSTLKEIVLIFKPPKKKKIQKHVLMFLIQVVIRNPQFTPKFFIIIALGETLPTFQFA